jgi:predicted butyrate kinase (DUF1464 family)
MKELEEKSREILKMFEECSEKHVVDYITENEGHGIILNSKKHLESQKMCALIMLSDRKDTIMRLCYGDVQNASIYMHELNQIKELLDAIMAVEL